MKRSRHVKKTIRYLYWSKDKKESENSVKATYMSCKEVKCYSSQEFASDLLVNLKALGEHTERMISQYRRREEIKKIVSDDSQQSLCIHVDWSQNGNLFQARQEKGGYYHELQVSINAAVAYTSNNVSFHCTISEPKSHKAPAVWASLQKILGSFDRDRLQVLYIITDSPTSQYHNKYNAYLTKKFAIQHNPTIIWVITESGHCKGPMDRVGASIKNEIDNAIALNPSSVITCASELWEFLPKANKQISMYQHSKGPMDGVGASIKNEIDNAVDFNMCI